MLKVIAHLGDPLPARRVLREHSCIATTSTLLQSIRMLSQQDFCRRHRWGAFEPAFGRSHSNDDVELPVNFADTYGLPKRRGTPRFSVHSLFRVVRSPAEGHSLRGQAKTRSTDRDHVRYIRSAPWAWAFQRRLQPGRCGFSLCSVFARINRALSFSISISPGNRTVLGAARAGFILKPAWPAIPRNRRQLRRCHSPLSGSIHAMEYDHSSLT